MAITYDAASNSGGQASVSTFNWNHTTGSGSNKALIIKTYARQNSGIGNLPVTAVTVGGNAATFVRGKTVTTVDGESIRTEQWIYLGPSGTQAVAITYTGVVDFAGADAISAFGVKQSTSPNTSNDGGQQVSATDDPSVTVNTSVDGCIIVDGVYDEAAIDFTATSPQTITAQFDPKSGGGDRAFASYKIQTSQGSATMSWTNGGDIDKWVSVVVAYEPEPDVVQVAPTSSGVTVTNKKKQKSYIFITNNGVSVRWDFDAIVRKINGASEVVISTDKDIDSYDDSGISINNPITIRVSSEKIGAVGLDYFSGYIARKSLTSSEGSETVSLRCFGNAAKLFRAIWRNGTTIVHDFTAGSTVTTIVQQIIDNYRTLNTSTEINYSSTSVENTADTIKDKYEGITFGDALNKAIDKAYTSGRRWFWRILADNLFTMKKSSVGADHSFIYGKHISSMEISEDLINAINEAFIYYNNATVTRYIDSESIGLHDNLSNLDVEGNVTDATTAGNIGNAIVQSNNPPILKIALTINETYDIGIEYINPGDTCEILNVPSSISNILSTNMIITKTTYRKDTVELELEINQPLVQNTLDNLKRSIEQTQVSGMPSTFNNG